MVGSCQGQPEMPRHGCHCQGHPEAPTMLVSPGHAGHPGTLLCPLHAGMPQPHRAPRAALVTLSPASVSQPCWPLLARLVSPPNPVSCPHTGEPPQGEREGQGTLALVTPATPAALALLCPPILPRAMTKGQVGTEDAPPRPSSKGPRRPVGHRLAQASLQLLWPRSF